MRNIEYYVSAMLPYMFGAIPLIAASRFVGIKQLHRKNLRTTLFHEAGLIIYAAFIMGLFSQTVLSHLYTFNWGVVQGEINLLPGKIIYDSIRLWQNGNRLYFVISLLGNIVMFVPFGFFTPLLWREKNVKDSMLAGFLASLTVEICQLPLAYRTSDVDDLILNTLGAFIGYAMYLLMRRVFPAFTDKFHLRNYSLEL